MLLAKELTTVIPLSKGLALLMFILLPFIGFLLGERYQAIKMTPVVIDDFKPIPTLEIKPTSIASIPVSTSQTENNKFPKEIAIGEYNQLKSNNQLLSYVEGIFSPDKQYMFFYDANTIYPKNLCDYALYKKHGLIYSFLIQGAEKISCSNEMGAYTGSFYEWTDNTHFLMQVDDGIIKLYDVLAANTPRILYTYDPKTSRFAGMNDTYDQWLMQKSGETGKISIYIGDTNHKSLSEDFSFLASADAHLIAGVLIPYDKLNKGFVLITRHYNNDNDTTWGEFYFLSTTNFQLKKIKIGKPSQTQHMGCGGFEYKIVSSKLNVIFLSSPSCLTVNQSDRESDGTVRLTL